MFRGGLGMKKPWLPTLFFAVRLPTLLAMFWRRHAAHQSITGVARKEPISFIIFRLDSLGDVVMTTPLFRALKQAHPDSRCTVVVQHEYKAMLVTNPHIDEILCLPPMSVAWLPLRVKTLLSALAFYGRHLRHRHFDYAISPRCDVDEHLATFLCALTNAGRRVGYSETTTPAKQQMNRGFDAAFDVCIPPGRARHEVLRNLAVAEALGLTVNDDRLEIALTERDRRRAAKWLAEVSPATKLIALGIGAHSPSRRWRLERYAACVNQLAAEAAVQPVIVCAAGERNDATRLAALLRRPPITVCGAGIREVCAVLERCEVFLGNDSGCAHLAAAMDCKTLVISRHPRDGDPDHGNSPLRFAPYCRHMRVLQPLSGRDGCRQACISAEPHCICRVSVEEAVAAARRMLHQVGPISMTATSPSSGLSQDLLLSHAADAVRRAVEILHPEVVKPMS